MSEQANPQPTPDASKINLHEDWEVQTWSRLLDTTEDDLRAAIKVVGPTVSAVRKYLGK